MPTDTQHLADFERLQAIARYDLDSPELHEELDRIVEETASRLNDSASAVNIMLDRAALTLATHGADSSWVALVGGLPAEWSYCTQVVESGEAYIVGKADVQHNPLAAAAGLNSYAGVPLTTPDGFVLGSHCVLHPEPGKFGEADIAVLDAAAEQIMEALDRSRIDG